MSDSTVSIVCAVDVEAGWLYDVKTDFDRIVFFISGLLLSSFSLTRPSTGTGGGVTFKCFAVCTIEADV